LNDGGFFALQAGPKKPLHDSKTDGAN